MNLSPLPLPPLPLSLSPPVIVVQQVVEEVPNSSPSVSHPAGGTPWPGQGLGVPAVLQ